MSGLLEPGSVGLTIGEMQQLAWKNSEDHRFHDNTDVPTKLMLIVSEAAEAMEDHRKGTVLETMTETGKPVGLPSELADIIIRVGDLAGILGVDLEAAVIRKMKYNAGRPHKHGKAY